MTDETITIDDLTITPLKQDYKLVHPALGTVDDTAFVGVWYTCQVKGEKKTTLRDLLFLVTSDRRKILANDALLNGMSWRLQYKPSRFKNRWSLDSVEAYLAVPTLTLQAFSTLLLRYGRNTWSSRMNVIMYITHCGMLEHTFIFCSARIRMLIMAAPRQQAKRKP